MYVSKRRKRKTLIRKLTYILPMILGVALISSFGVMAYLKWSGSVKNTFTAEESVSPSLEETFDKKIKENVLVHVGETEYSVYVRAAIVAVWENKDGEVDGKMPVLGTDYTLELNVDSETDANAGWFEKDGFYYHKKPVVSKEDTEVLIKSSRPLRAAPTEGYLLNVKIVTQTIQSAGTTDEGEIPAVTDVWNVDVERDGTLAK